MNKKVLISGGSRGIGKSIKELFENNGFFVFSPTRQQLDLANLESIDHFLAAFSEDIDILINNAGINPVQDLEVLSNETIQEVLNINLVAPIKLIQHFIKPMKKQKWGRIVNISSIWGSISKPGRSIYSVSKSGLDGLTRSLAVEFSQFNILSNSVAPGFVDTELTRKNNSPEQIKDLLSNIPLHKLATTNDISELVFYLCSEKNNFITGQTIIADGGYTCL